MRRKSLDEKTLHEFYRHDPITLTLAQRLAGKLGQVRPDVLGVVVLLYDAPTAIVDIFVDGLLKSQHAQETRLYIIDNSDTLSLGREVKKALTDEQRRRLLRDPRITAVNVLNGQGNMGFRGGHNLGVTAAVEDGCAWILMINDDGYVHPHAIGALRRVFDEVEDAAVAAPAVLFGEEFSKAGDDLLQAGKNSARKFIAREGGLISEIDRAQAYYEKRRFPLECCVLMPADVAVGCALLDTKPFIYLEGHEMGSKIYATKQRMVFAADALYIHPRNLFDYASNAFKSAFLWRAYGTLLEYHYRTPFLDYFSVYRRKDNAEFNAFNPQAVHQELAGWANKNPLELLIVARGMLDGLLGRVQPRLAQDPWEPLKFRNYWEKYIGEAGSPKATASSLLQDHSPHLVTWLLINGRRDSLSLLQTLPVADLPSTYLKEICEVLTNNLRDMATIAVDSRSPEKRSAAMETLRHQCAAQIRSVTKG